MNTTLRWLAVVGGITAGVPAPAARAQSSLPIADAVRFALETHPEVAAALASVARARAGVGEARAAWWPSLVYRAQLTRHEEPMLVAPLHGFELTSAPPFDRSLFRSDLRLGWTLFDGGARGSRSRAAKEEASAFESDRRSREMQVISRVVGSYLQALTLRDVLRAVEMRLEALEAERARVRRMLAVGSAADVELYRVEAEIAEAEADRASTAARLEAEERELERLIGPAAGRVSAGRLVPVTLSPAASALEPPRELAERAARKSAEVESARRRARSAAAERRAAVAEWTPTLEAFGDAITYGGTEGDFTTEWQGGIALSYPLFTGGARARRVERATASKTIATRRVEQAEKEAARSADAAFTALVEARESAEALRAAVVHRREVARVERLALEQGAGVQTDYLRAEAALLRARASRIEASHRYVAARVELARALGELTAQWVAENLVSPREEKEER